MRGHASQLDARASYVRMDDEDSAIANNDDAKFPRALAGERRCISTVKVWSNGRDIPDQEANIN